jgi:hypothetical protein
MPRGEVSSPWRYIVRTTDECWRAVALVCGRRATFVHPSETTRHHSHDPHRRSPSRPECRRHARPHTMGRFGPVRRVPPRDVVYQDRWVNPYRDEQEASTWLISECEFTIMSKETVRHWYCIMASCHRGLARGWLRRRPKRRLSGHCRWSPRGRCRVFRPC